VVAEPELFGVLPDVAAEVVGVAPFGIPDVTAECQSLSCVRKSSKW